MVPHPEAYLASATCVATFNIDKQIRYRVADIENAFRSTVVSQAVGTNVADNAPPNIPRFTMQSGQKVISVSQIQCQMDMNFAEQRKTFDQVGAVVRKNFAGFWAGVRKLKSLEEVRDVGLVLSFNVSSKKPIPELSEELYSRYLNIPSLGNVASVGFQTGFTSLDGNIFINLSVGTYEVREAHLENSMHDGGQIFLALDQMRVSESGVEVKWDVNSKPLVSQGEVTPENIDDVLFESLNQMLKEHNGDFFSWIE